MWKLAILCIVVLAVAFGGGVAGALTERALFGVIDQNAALVIQAGSAVVQAISSVILVTVTIFYAFATRTISRETGVLARETEKLASETSDLLNASVQPILVDVPPRMYPIALGRHESPGPTPPDVSFNDHGSLVVESQAGVVMCSVPFRNIGSGVALIRGFGIRSAADPGVGWNGQASKTIVPPGELTRLTFRIPKDRAELEHLRADTLEGNFLVEVGYTNNRGEQALLTRAHAWRYEGIYSFRQVFLLRAGETEPFAASGPADPSEPPDL